MHGNVKSPDDLRDAVAVGVGRIVLDSSIEIAYLAGLARRRQKVLLRVTPDLDIHGHRAVTTGISAFRTTCLTRVMPSERPFARAVLT